MCCRRAKVKVAGVIQTTPSLERHCHIIRVQRQTRNDNNAMGTTACERIILQVESHCPWLKASQTRCLRVIIFIYISKKKNSPSFSWFSCYYCLIPWCLSTCVYVYVCVCVSHSMRMFLFCRKEKNVCYGTRVFQFLQCPDSFFFAKNVLISIRWFFFFFFVYLIKYTHKNGREWEWKKRDYIYIYISVGCSRNFSFVKERGENNGE